jgi:hypothetical protein
MLHFRTNNPVVTYLIISLVTSRGMTFIPIHKPDALHELFRREAFQVLFRVIT